MEYGVTLKPGTRVRTLVLGSVGTVMPHDSEYCQGLFPVCFDRTNIWRLLGADEVEIIEPESEKIEKSS